MLIVNSQRRREENFLLGGQAKEPYFPDTHSGGFRIAGHNSDWFFRYGLLITLVADPFAPRTML